MQISSNIVNGPKSNN